jgi:DNA polymerase-3 subunit beta
MRLTCTQKDLVGALSITNKAVDASTTLPVLNNVLMKAEGKKLYFTATNLEIAINYWIEADIKNEGQMTVPSKLLTNYVGYLREQPLDLSIEEGDTLLLKTKDSKTKMKGIPASEFPPIPMVEKEGEVTISASDFAHGISQVVFAAAINSTRPILSGVYFYVNKNELKLVATDSYRLAEKTVAVKKASGGISCIIPAKTIMELGLILGMMGREAEDVDVVVSKNQVLFTFGRVRITSRLIDGQFPNYQQIIPKTHKTQLTIDANELSLMLKRVNLFARENNNKVILRAEKGSLKVSTDSTQYGEGEVDMTVKQVGEDNEVAVNSQFILDVLANIGSNEIMIELGDKIQPVVLKQAQKADYIHIIMPLKI